MECRGSEELRRHQEHVQQEQAEVRSAERGEKIAELLSRLAALDPAGAAKMAALGERLTKVKAEQAKRRSEFAEVKERLDAL
jgi:hypothetical protein